MSDSPASALRIADTPAGIQFKVHVQPRASKNEICGVHGEELKVRLTAPPVDDAANRLCIEFFAGRLGVPKSRVAILAGMKSRHKTVRVEGIDAGELVSLLGLAARE
jgi:uncharacterized protein